MTTSKHWLDDNRATLRDVSVHDRITLVPTGDEQDEDEMPSRPMPPSKSDLKAARARIRAALLGAKEAGKFFSDQETRDYLTCIQADLALALELLR